MSPNPRSHHGASALRTVSRALGVTAIATVVATGVQPLGYAQDTGSLGSLSAGSATQEGSLGSLTPNTAGELSREEMIQLLLRDTNAARATRNLPPLAFDSYASEGAQLWADHLVATETFAHPPVGDGKYLRITQSENLIKGVDVREAVEGWMRSPGHRDNILSPDPNVIGFGIGRQSDGVPIFVQRFEKVNTSYPKAMTPAAADTAAFDLIKSKRTSQLEQFYGLAADPDLTSSAKRNAKANAVAGEATNSTELPGPFQLNRKVYGRNPMTAIEEWLADSYGRALLTDDKFNLIGIGMERTAGDIWYVSIHVGSEIAPLLFHLETVSRINEARTAIGLPTLTIDTGLASAAEAWAGKMAGQRAYEYDSSFRGGQLLGQAWGVNLSDSVNGWFADPGSREHFLDPRRRTIGVGAVMAEDGMWWVDLRLG